MDRTTSFNAVSSRRILALRQHLGLSQTEFANKVGVSRAYQSDVENGHCKINVNLLAGIGLAFGDVEPTADLHWLVLGVEPATDKAGA